MTDEDLFFRHLKHALDAVFAGQLEDARRCQEHAMELLNREKNLLARSRMELQYGLVFAAVNESVQRGSASNQPETGARSQGPIEVKRQKAGARRSTKAHGAMNRELKRRSKKERTQRTPLKSQPQDQRDITKKTKKQPATDSASAKRATRDAERRRELQATETRLRILEEKAKFQELLTETGSQGNRRRSMPPCQCSHAKTSHSVERGCVSPRCKCRAYNPPPRRSGEWVRIVSGGLPTLGKNR